VYRHGIRQVSVQDLADDAAASAALAVGDRRTGSCGRQGLCGKILHPFFYDLVVEPVWVMLGWVVIGDGGATMVEGGGLQSGVLAG